MADKPRGFYPIRFLGGAAYNGSVSRYRKEASVVLGYGDPVVITGESSTEGTNNADADGVAIVTRASAASGTITGVVMGFTPDGPESNEEPAFKKTFFDTADTGYVHVADHPHIIFGIQEDSVGNNLARGDVGEGVDFAISDADTDSGYSNAEIDSSTAASQAGNADQLRVMEMVQKPGNNFGDDNVEWAVMINEHTYNATQTII